MTKQHVYLLLVGTAHAHIDVHIPLFQDSQDMVQRYHCATVVRTVATIPALVKIPFILSGDATQICVKMQK